VHTTFTVVGPNNNNLKKAIFHPRIGTHCKKGCCKNIETTFHEAS
jgi:hypothetical protein